MQQERSQRFKVDPRPSVPSPSIAALFLRANTPRRKGVGALPDKVRTRLRALRHALGEALSVVESLLPRAQQPWAMLDGLGPCLIAKGLATPERAGDEEPEAAAHSIGPSWSIQTVQARPHCADDGSAIATMKHKPHKPDGDRAENSGHEDSFGRSLAERLGQAAAHTKTDPGLQHPGQRRSPAACGSRLFVELRRFLWNDFHGPRANRTALDLSTPSSPPV